MMEIGSAFSSGIEGINNSLKIAEQSAQQIATATLGTESQGPAINGAQSAENRPAINTVENGAIGLLEAERGVAGSARTLQTADEVLGTIIDIKV